MNEELLYPSGETINRLTRELQLEGADKYTQDWEYEVADINQLPKYINYYKTEQLNLNEKSTLMRIILEAYNDYRETNNKEDVYHDVINDLLVNEYFIHQETLKYWGCGNEELENCFAITPFIRIIRDKMADAL